MKSINAQTNAAEATENIRALIIQVEKATSSFTDRFYGNKAGGKTLSHLLLIAKSATGNTWNKHFRETETKLEQTEQVTKTQIFGFRKGGVGGGRVDLREKRYQNKNYAEYKTSTDRYTL